MNKPARLKKAEFLPYFGAMTPQPIQPCPVAYKHTGSTYSEDGIRIVGSREFVDSVLSRLTDLLKYENGATRLAVNYQQSVDRESQMPMDSWNCYLQVHERGDEAKHLNRFLAAHGVTSF